MYIKWLNVFVVSVNLDKKIINYIVVNYVRNIRQNSINIIHIGKYQILNLWMNMIKENIKYLVYL